MSEKQDRDASANQVECWDCANHATERLEDMFVDIVQRQRIEKGQRPARRTVFLKQHGAAHGFFEPDPSLPEELRVGVFAQGRLQCWVRFSSDTLPTLPDLKTTIGLGIKLFGVPGPKLFGEGDTADFILQNYDIFFVPNATAMCEFTTAGVIDGDSDAYLDTHPQTKRILDEMAHVEASCLTAKYWAILPFALGKDASGRERYVKYQLVPEGQPAGQPFDQNDYLALDLQSRLRNGDARFDLLIQERTDPARMPLDDATVRWDSPWRKIARLTLPRQNILTRGQNAYGENLSFNIWRVPPEQAPQGSIAAARRVVYQGSGDQRRLANGVTLTEPMQPAPGQTASHATTSDRTTVVKAAIYPAIGVARVGNSPDAWFIGPEVTDPPAHPSEFYRDSGGRLKRQAARFRAYGLNAQGEAVIELTGHPAAKVEWTAHLANQKSSWYEFQLALDIPEAKDAPPSLLRNATVSDRNTLSIDPGPRSVSGANVHGGDAYRFDSGKFVGTPVYLGELHTDEAGRLIVLGGRGHSASFDGSEAVTFANNDGWHDDVSDGPVTARVSYDGVPLEVAPAWVVVAPPNYAPMQKSVRTLWDLLRSVAIDAGMLAKPARPSFQRDIRPIFERMTRLSWVNQGFAAAFGWGGQFDLSSQAALARLSSPSPAYLELRRTIKNNFRHPDVDAWSPVPWPWLYGDAMSIPPAQTPRQNSTLSPLQLEFLDQWVLGEFEADYDPSEKPPKHLSDLPPAAQAEMLTQAALEFCLADAFHPGCEMTWPMRQAGMYMAAFRVKHAPEGWVVPSYGAQLDSDVWTLPGGPIDAGQVPGGLTRWMAVPWQTDTASCRSGYDKGYDPYLPTFWPARVPNEVMTPADYQRVLDTGLELGDRLQAFANRSNWDEPLGLSDPYTEQINFMIAHFDQLGVVSERPGVSGSKDFPAVMQVSDRPDTADRAQLQSEKAGPRAFSSLERPKRPALRGLQGTDLSRIDKVRRFPRGLR
jgi:hypothetical protein